MPGTGRSFCRGPVARSRTIVLKPRPRTKSPSSTRPLGVVFQGRRGQDDPDSAPMSSPTPIKPRSRCPDQQPSDPEPEQLCCLWPRKARWSASPTPARSVLWEYLGYPLSSAISCGSCSIIPISGVTFTIRDSAKRLKSANLFAISCFVLAVISSFTTCCLLISSPAAFKRSSLEFFFIYLF